MAFWSWSKTAGTNSSADPTINWSEGQSPSSVNDSARSMMARTAEWRDDITGAIVTTGTSTNYAVASNQVFDTLAHMNGALLAFTPHITCGATVLLNVDGLGAKPLRTSPSVELLAGMLIQGTPYVATFSNSDAAWYLRGFFGNPYNVPIAAGMDFWGPTAPNSSFAFPSGQAISRMTYATLFAIIGNTYGAGDGTTTFNLPDKRGRVTASADNMGGSAANRLTAAGSGIDAVNISASGGTENVTLLTANLPAYTPAGTIVSTFNSSGDPVANVPGPIQFGGTGSGGNLVSASVTSTFTGTAQGGTSTAVRNAQPTIVGNYIMRVL